MSLIINHNLMAGNTARNLRAHYGELGTSVRRLSSGLRIGTAADDAAGLAIRELMRADIKSISQGIRNANDAISMIQTADGALSVIDEKLIRMKELAVQASTGTYNSDQRLIIDSEYQAMATEINRIAASTDFNGINLLNGHLSGTHDGSGLSSTGQMKIHFGTGNDSAEDYYYVRIGSATVSSLGLKRGIQPYSYSQMLDFATEIRNSNALYSGLTNVSALYTFSDLVAADQNWLRDKTGKTFNDSSAMASYDAGGMHLIVAQDTEGSVHYFRSSGFIPQDDVQTWTNGLAAVSISTQKLAQQALEKIDNAIVSKDKIRAHLGGLQNRLENTITNLSIQAENMQAAESRISDVDVAEEMTAFVRNQILTQAAVSMLSQANSMPKMAMQLIG